MSGINCFEARMYGIQFEFLTGIEVDEVSAGSIYINGLGAWYFEEEKVKKVTDSNIEEIFAGEEDVWVGEIKGSVFIFQAGITPDNNHIVPEEPEFSGNRYVKLRCEKLDEVMVLGDGRIVFRIFAGDEQDVMVEMRKEAVVTVEHADGSTAIFEYTGTGFKTA